ncbi:MAG TPA: DUF1800 domain-containing protein [Gemmatimonadaceae bacterium]|nr:DUF1800 domain-containing protein [Gemmatimonadaceae bacterium]
MIMRARFSAATIVSLVTLAACGGGAARVSPAPIQAPMPPVIGVRDLTVDQQAAQAVARLTFGPRPGEVDRINAIGTDRWIERQLAPESVNDATLESVLLGLPVWTMSVKTLVDSFPPQDVYLRKLRAARGLAPNAQLQLTADDSAAMKTANDRANMYFNQFQAAKVVRAQMSERQLVEVLTDFWENHFSVFAGKMPTRFTLLQYDRDIIRPRVLGKFRDLLGAVAHSPAMLYYLDNFQSVADSNHMTLPEYRTAQRTGHAPVNHRRNGLNENYGRELLELHTMGVDGGYTQKDVIAVARALTGWTLDDPRAGGEFIFREAQHDAGVKVVLGHTMGAGRGVEDGEEVLDILARHPATAHYIAFKLVRRFVSDTPGKALVDKAAETFRRTDGDLKEVMRTILTSPEFFSRVAYRAKTKSPFELVLSARRIMNASPDTSASTAFQIQRLGQQLFGHLAPNGWPETGDQWINAGSLLDRINFGVQVGGGRLRFAPVEQWPGWAVLSTVPLDKQVDGIVDQLLGGNASPETRSILFKGQNPLASADMPPPVRPSLKDLLGIALGSPEFQRR